LPSIQPRRNLQEGENQVRQTAVESTAITIHVLQEGMMSGNQVVREVFLLGFGSVVAMNLSPLGLVLRAESPRAGESGAYQASSEIQQVGALMVGRWTATIDRVAATETCRWILKNTVVECEGQMGDLMWKWLLFWDRTSRQVKYSSVLSDGTWSQSEGAFVVTQSKISYAGVGGNPNGQRWTVTVERTFEDAGTTQIESGTMVSAGMNEPFRDVWRRVSR